MLYLPWKLFVNKNRPQLERSRGRIEVNTRTKTKTTFEIDVASTYDCGNGEVERCWKNEELGKIGVGRIDAGELRARKKCGAARAARAAAETPLERGQRCGCNMATSLRVVVLARTSRSVAPFQFLPNKSLFIYRFSVTSGSSVRLRKHDYFELKK